MNACIGIIGAGTIADAYYIPTLKHLGYTDRVVFDVNTESSLTLAQKHSIRTVGMEDLIDQASAIIIATPPHTHFELLKQCISAGNKTVICEKPFLFSKEEALSIIELEKQYGSKVLVAHIRRVFTAIESAKQLIPTLPLGVLQKAEIWEGGRFSYKPKSDYVTHNAYGGVLLDTGSHALDCFLYVTGLTQTPLQCTVHNVQKDKAEPAHEVRYSFSLNDINLDLNLSRYRVLANKMTLYYENGMVEIPLGLKPNIAATLNGTRKIYASENACLNYMSEAFKSELGLMLLHNDNRFNAADFVNLTSILETLYNA